GRHSAEDPRRRGSREPWREAAAAAACLTADRPPECFAEACRTRAGWNPQELLIACDPRASEAPGPRPAIPETFRHGNPRTPTGGPPKPLSRWCRSAL